MSPFVNALFPAEDRRRLQIVQKLIEQTRSRKLVWMKQGTTYETVLKGGTHVGFVAKEGQNALMRRLIPGGWAQFSIRRKDGSEVFKVEATSLFIAVTNPPPNRDPLQYTIDELFSVIEQREGEDLDRILSELG